MRGLNFTKKGKESSEGSWGCVCPGWNVREQWERGCSTEEGNPGAKGDPSTAVPSLVRTQFHRVSAELGAGTGVHQQLQTQPGDEQGPGTTQSEKQEMDLQHGSKVRPEDGAGDRAGDRHDYSITQARSGCPGPWAEGVSGGPR